MAPAAPSAPASDGPDSLRAKNEAARLDVLHSYKILDTATEDDFDHITSLAALVCNAPIALISLVDEDRLWFKSAYGILVKDIPRRSAFCSHAILDPELPLIIEDARVDPRVKECHLVVGEPFVRFYAGFPLIVDEGHVIGTLCILDRETRALTPSQMEALYHLGRQVIRLLELRKAYFRLNGIERMRSDLSNMIVHDLRSPLAAASMFLDSFMLASAQVVPEELRDDISKSMEILGSLTEMVSSIIDVARLEEEQMPIHRLPSDMNAIARAAIDLVKGPEAEVRLSGDGLTHAACDAPLLTRVIGNLVSNAMKHSQGSQVEVHVSTSDGQAIVTVTDHGPGIPPERHLRIFQKFGSVQGDPKNRAYSTGLGLPFCKMVIDAHGGTIGLTAAPGGGSRFWFTVPLKAADPSRLLVNIGGPANRSCGLPRTSAAPHLPNTDSVLPASSQ
jgi:signal transduction histidine kinase